MEEGEKELEETSKALEYFRDNQDRTTADAKQEKEPYAVCKRKFRN
jgi:hypothetical protein